MVLSLPREKVGRVAAVLPFRLLPVGKISRSGSHQVAIQHLPHGKTVRALPDDGTTSFACSEGSAFPELPFALFGWDAREENSKTGEFR